jgi:hypothetical protein
MIVPQTVDDFPRTAENDIRKLHVVGTAGISARLGLRGGITTQDQPTRLVLAAPRSYRIRGELIRLPHVVGVASRPLYSTATARPEQVASAA